MKMSIKKSLQGLLLVPLLALGVSVVTPVFQGDVAQAQISGGIKAANGGTEPTDQKSLGDMVKTVVNLLLYVIGAAAVIMIIFGGFKYITSGGDAAGVTSAKNTIMYAVIGLIVAALAFAIVNFVVGSDGSLNLST